MIKNNLESLVKATPDFIKAHKTSCFLTGAALYASSLYLDYKTWTSFQEGHWDQVILYCLGGRIPSLSGLGLMGAPAWFYYSKKVLGRKRAAHAWRYVSNLSSRLKS